MKIEKSIAFTTSVRKSYVPEFFHRNAMRERIQRCYKTDAELAAEKAAAETAFLTKVEEKIAAFKTGLVEVKSFEAVKTQLEEMSKKDANIKENADFKTLLGEVDKLITDFKSFKEASVGEDRGARKGSFGEMLKKNKAKIDSFLTNKTGAVELEYKTTATTTSTDIDGRENIAAWHEGGAVGHLPVRQPFMREMFRNAGTDKEYINYMDQETATRNAQNVALCGATNNTTKTTFKVRNVRIDKVRDKMDVCLDSMSDYPFMTAEVDKLINESLRLKIDNDLLLGTGVSPILNGVIKSASTFAATGSGAASDSDYSNAVENANIIDLISVMGAQIRAFASGSASKSIWRPNYVLMNPKDFQLMKFLKDSQKNYIKSNVMFPTLFVNNSGQCFIDGMLIVDNILVPSNQLYIGDFTKGTVYAKPGIGVEFSYENATNFETETVTVKVFERLQLLIRNVDANAFMHCADIEAAIVAITKGGIDA